MPNRSQVLLLAQGIGRSRGGQPVFEDVTLQLHPGESLAISGPSGAGKSTLLHCLGMLERSDSGTLRIAGVDATRVTAARRTRLRRSTVSHLFQNYALVASWTVRKNLDVAFIGQRAHPSDRPALRQRALERVGLNTAGVERRRAHSLSGGEQQRLALARLLVRRPKLVLADEPTAALDDDNVAMVLDVLSDIRADGAAVVVATHDPRVVDWAGAELTLTKPPAATERRLRWFSGRVPRASPRSRAH